MILLDEIEVGFEQKHRKEKEKLPRESLPPYSPRLLLNSPDNRFPAANNHSSAQIINTQRINTSTLHPRSASIPPFGYHRSYSSLTLNSHASLQTLVGALPSPPPSAPASLSPSPTFQSQYSTTPCINSVHATKRPPTYVRASNNVYIQRDSASITDSFLIDPSLYIPDCLLPDETDLVLCNEKGDVNGGKQPRGKRKSERVNLCLITRSGDISVDVWIHEGGASYDRSRNSSRGRRRADSESLDHRTNTQSSMSSESEESDYWASDFSDPSTLHPLHKKNQSSANIYLRTETGSISVRIHAKSHQRLNLNIKSVHGSISVGIPRHFFGPLHVNTSPLPAPSRANSYDSAPQSQLGSTYSTFGGSTLSFSLNTPDLPSKQSVQLSKMMENIVTPLSTSEARKNSKGLYAIGDKTLSSYYDQSELPSLIDEMFLDSLTGSIFVSLNYESQQQKTDKLITKLLNKAR